MVSPFRPGHFARPQPVPLIQDEPQLRLWLDNFEQKLEEMSAAYNEASFSTYSGTTINDLNQYDKLFGLWLGESSYQANVREWLPRVTEPLLKQRLSILRQNFLEAEVSKNKAIYELRNLINARLLNFQPNLRGQKISRSEINDVLRNEPDSQRRKVAFEEPLRPLAEQLAPLVTELLRRRNTEARRLGYVNYSDLHLELLGLERSRLFALFDELESLTDAPYKAFLEQSRRAAGLEKLEQWDLNYLAEAQANLPIHPFPRDFIIPKAFALLRMFGLEPEKLPIQVQKREIPFAGLCYSIRIPGDIRILANPRDGYPSYRTMFHEFGHGLHFGFNRQIHYLLKRESSVFNEGMAEWLAYFTQQPEWLLSNGLSAEQVANYQQENLGRRLLRFRSLLAQARFEIEAYSNLEGNLDQLCAEIESHYLCTSANLTPRWAASSFPTTHPIYRQNYILAEMIAAQTHATLQKQFGNFWKLDAAGRVAAFNFMAQNYYAPGAAIEWPDKIRQATNQELNVSALAQGLGL